MTKPAIRDIAAQTPRGSRPTQELKPDAWTLSRTLKVAVAVLLGAASLFHLAAGFWFLNEATLFVGAFLGFGAVFLMISQGGTPVSAQQLERWRDVPLEVDSFHKRALLISEDPLYRDVNAGNSEYYERQRQLFCD